MSNGRYCLILDKSDILDVTFWHTQSMCFAKLKHLSIFIPNNFSDSEHSISWLLTMISKFEWHLDSLWEVPIRIHFVLFSFRTILFCLHHCTTLLTSICRPLFILCISFEELRNVASSAKMSISECSMWRGRSLIKSINKRGPNTEPCGTPAKIYLFSDEIFPMRTSWVWSSK